MMIIITIMTTAFCIIGQSATPTNAAYTLEMGQTEHFCGTASMTYPTSVPNTPCSLTSPRWSVVAGLGFNPLNKQAYTIDMYGNTLTRVPVPDFSTGNVELVIGRMSCAAVPSVRLRARASVRRLAS
eukprot:PhM_4_TR8286/c1_g1_i1/m.92646